ncbi:hypothetical protein ACX6XY_15325 [Streptomyces sp. O3]
MRAHLAETTHQLARLLWQQHTVYRDRTGGMVIRGDHVERWISLAATGTRGEVRIRAGRLLDGGTTAPARAETVLPLTSDTGELAAACRRLLAETTSETATPPNGTRRAAKRPRPERRRRSRRVALWLTVSVVTATTTLIALTAYSANAG